MLTVVSRCFAGEKLRLHPKGFDLKLHLAAVLHCDDKKAVSSMEWRMAVVSPRLWCNAAGKLLGSREIVAVLHRHGADDDVAVVAASGILRLAERDLSPAEAFHRELLVLTPDF